MNLRLLLLVLLLPAAPAIAAPPTWWSEENTRVLKSGAPVDLSANYAPANLGQLKNMAAQAKKHLDSKLPGGSGPAVAALVAGFGTNLTQAQRAENYAPANLGQLKAIAKPFYDRLVACGYDTRANLIAHGYPASWTPNYPWNPSTPVSENYAPVNLGQLKLVFSFDLAGDLDNAGTGDGLPDWWEIHYFGSTTVGDSSADPDGDGLTNLQEYQQGGNPSDYFSQGPNTITPKIFVFSGGGVNVPLGEYSADPIVYKVVNAATGESLVHAPVTVAVTEGTGLLALTRGGATQTSFVLNSDNDGLVKVYFKVP